MNDFERAKAELHASVGASLRPVLAFMARPVVMVVGLTVIMAMFVGLAVYEREPTILALPVVAWFGPKLIRWVGETTGTRGKR